VPPNLEKTLILDRQLGVHTPKPYLTWQHVWLAHLGWNNLPSLLFISVLSIVMGFVFTTDGSNFF